VIRKIIILSSIICFNYFLVYANNITDGNIQLIVNERTGDFTLYCRDSPEQRNYESLFNNEQGSSYAAIIIDGKEYRLGGRDFPAQYEIQNGYPAFIYKSVSAAVTQIFTPVITGNSSVINGIKITYIINNTGETNYSAGLRFLLDTNLGEGRGGTPFSLSSARITNETRISNTTGEKYWISKNNRAALMGSIINPSDNTQKAPDYIIFANWKRLHDSPWAFRFLQGRSFGSDSAVCYYYEPVPLESGGSITYSIFLTAEDTDWYNMEASRETQQQAQIQRQIQTESPENDLRALLEIQGILIRFIKGEIDLSEQALDEIENAVNKYR